MKIQVELLSFFVISDEDGAHGKQYKHYQTLDGDDYEDSELKRFLNGEFVRICKRKAERHPASESVPTKIGRFIVEPEHDLTSNPNYNLFQRLLASQTEQDFIGHCDEMVRMYLDTSAVRGGAFIVARTTFPNVSDTPVLFIMKCDFEPNIVRIADERSLVAQVEMAISSRNIKSLQYPYMPEEGMLDEWEIKIHQSSHARYFEDFLKFVSYEKTLPQVISEKVLDLVRDDLEHKWQSQPEYAAEERQREEESIELWVNADKRELQERWSHDQVAEATKQLVEHKPDLEMKFKLNGVSVRALMADYGAKLHVARHHGRYVVLIEGDSFEFEKGVSPVELLQPDPLERVLEKMNEAMASSEDDNAPWD
jgi:hypothetical protein